MSVPTQRPAHEGWCRPYQCVVCGVEFCECATPPEECNGDLLDPDCHRDVCRTDHYDEGDPDAARDRARDAALDLQDLFLPR